MRRRVTSGEAPGRPPRRLRRFALDDWLDEVPPEPAWYREREAAAKPGDRYSWRLFMARIAYMRARRAWVREQGGTVEALDALNADEREQVLITAVTPSLRRARPVGG